MGKLSTLRRPSRSPERERLRQAIERRDGAAEALAELEAALRQIDGRILDAREAVTKANAAVEDTVAEAGRQAAAGKPVPSARAARQRAEDARDALTALLAGRDELKSRLPSARNSEAIARITVGDRVRDLVAAEPAVKKLLAAAEEAWAVAVDRGRAAALLDNNFALPGWSDTPHGEREAAVRAWLAALETEPDAAPEF